jgi:hypothetical protein
MAVLIKGGDQNYFFCEYFVSGRSFYFYIIFHTFQLVFFKFCLYDNIEPIVYYFLSEIMGKSVENGKTGRPISLAEELKREFGSTVNIPEWERRSPKTFAEGARCLEDSGCQFVNTRRCDYTRCLRSSLRHHPTE